MNASNAEKEDEQHVTRVSTEAPPSRGKTTAGVTSVAASNSKIVEKVGESIATTSLMMLIISRTQPTIEPRAPASMQSAIEAAVPTKSKRSTIIYESAQSLLERRSRLCRSLCTTILLAFLHVSDRLWRDHAVANILAQCRAYRVHTPRLIEAIVRPALFHLAKTVANRKFIFVVDDFDANYGF